MAEAETAPAPGGRGLWRDAGAVRDRWRWTLGVGLVLVACGVAAILMPYAADFATGTLLGAVLVVAGVAKIAQGLNAAEATAVNWTVLLGASEVVGGILIYLMPLKGALAVALLLAVVFLVEGVMQVALALRMRPGPGWAWMAGAGVVALGASAGLVATARWTAYYTPGTLAGIAILAAGAAFVAMALAKRRMPR